MEQALRSTDTIHRRVFERAWAVALLVLTSLLLATCNGTRRQQASLNAGLQKFRAKDYQGCVTELDRVVAADPTNVLAYGSRAFCRSARGDVDGAIADYSSAIALSPTNPATYNNRGAERMRKHDVDGALADFAAAVHLNPRYAQAYRNLGTAKRLKGDLRGALDDYGHAIDLEPSTAQGYLDRGAVRVDVGDIAGGLADFSDAIARNPQSAAAYAARASARRQQDDNDGALRDYTRAIELDPHNALFVYARGCIYYDRQLWEQALVDFSKAIQFDPTHAEYARLRTGLVQLRLGHRREAGVALRELSASANAEPDDWARRIATFLDGEQSRGEFLTSAQSTYSPDNKRRECQAYFYAGSLRLINRDLHGVRADFEHAVTIGPATVPEYWSARAELRALKSRPSGIQRR